jgi:hypothetical protein
MEQEPSPAGALRAPVAKQPRTKKSFWSGSTVLIPIAAILLGNWAARTIGFLGYAIVAVPLVLALWLSSWYTKRKSPDPAFLNWFAWSNTATWLFPPLGLFTAVATFGMSSAWFPDSTVPPARPRRYRILGAVGFVLSVLNGASGAWVATQ